MSAYAAFLAPDQEAQQVGHLLHLLKMCSFVLQDSLPLQAHSPRSCTQHHREAAPVPASVIPFVSTYVGSEYAGLYDPAGRAYPDIFAKSQNFSTFWLEGFVPVDGTSALTPLAAGIFIWEAEHGISERMRIKISQGSVLKLTIGAKAVDLLRWLQGPQRYHHWELRRL